MLRSGSVMGSTVVAATDKTTVKTFCPERARRRAPVRRPVTRPERDRMGFDIRNCRKRYP
jgi:hypothetical protein